MRAARFRLLGVFAAIVFIAWGFGAATPRASAEQPPLIQAAGHPIVDCTGATLSRLEAGMGRQYDALRRTEEQVKSAEETHHKVAGQTDAMIQEQLKSWLQDQVNWVDLAQRSGALTGDRAKELATLIDRLKTSQERLKLAQSTANGLRTYAAAVRTNAADFEALATFLSNSGLADALAQRAARLLPPPGQLVVQGFILARDVTYNAAEEIVSAQDLATMRDVRDRLRAAIRNNEERIRNLREMMADPQTCPNPPQQVQESPKPTPPQDAPQPTKKKPGFSAKRLGITLGVAGAAAATGLVLSQNLTSNNGDSSGSGGANSQPSIVSFSAWICRGSSCSGTLTIDFPMVMNKGVITVGTNSLFLGQANVSPTTPAGRVTFNMTKSPYTTCYGTQTTVAIWNGPTIDSGPAMFQLSTSIPVTCQ
jgi:hypothetical protein